MTTTALPPTTTEPHTATRTLRTACPDCINGYCDEDTLHCKCYFDTRFGHWAGGNRGAGCTICAPGYYGAACLMDCPGSPCLPCNGHGVCDDGVDGTGLCTCFADAVNGFWDGPDCNVCAYGYYGPACMEVCPCIAPTSNGFCDGNGLCVCDPGWSGFACDICNSTVVASCPFCPNDCSGNGICVPISGTYNGVCECDAFYATPDCSVSCPDGCAGVGKCFNGTTGNGTCLCPTHFALPGCATCEDGWWGL